MIPEAQVTPRIGGGRSIAWRTSVDLAAVPDFEDNDGQLIVVELVQDPPVTRPGTPRSGVAHQRGGLPETLVVNETDEQLIDPLAHGRIQSVEFTSDNIA